jgi:hypothetical protein
MRRAETSEHAAQEGMTIAHEIAVELRPMLQGIQVATADGDIDVALAVLDGLR